MFQIPKAKCPPNTETGTQFAALLSIRILDFGGMMKDLTIVIGLPSVFLFAWLMSAHGEDTHSKNEKPRRPSLSVELGADLSGGGNLQGLSLQLQGSLYGIDKAEDSVAAARLVLGADAKIELEAGTGLPLLTDEQKDLVGEALSGLGWTGSCTSARCLWKKGKLNVELKGKKSKNPKGEVTAAKPAEKANTSTNASTKGGGWSAEEWKEAVNLIAKLGKDKSGNKMSESEANKFLRAKENQAILSEVYPLAVGLAKLRSQHGNKVKSISLMVSAQNCGPCQMQKKALNDAKVAGDSNLVGSGDFLRKGGAESGEFVLLLNTPDYHYQTPLAGILGVATFPTTLSGL